MTGAYSGCVLPPLPLQDPVLDPCADRRGDADWLRRAWQDPDARVYTFAGERVLMREPGSRELATRPLTDSPLDADGLPVGDWVFLGVAGRTPCFALRAPHPVPEDRVVPVRAVGIADPADPELRIGIGGLAVLNWHRRHPHCPLCGAATVIAEAGWSRRCPADDSQHFPRVDPAVIMLVLDDERALLGRQARWQETWFSTLAGFVEPGETLENAVAREVREEVGIEVSASAYRGSQPWPFPSSLMIGFHAQAATTDIAPDRAEIAEARWFTRAELAAACRAGDVRLPPRFSISRWLIELWFGAPLPGDWSRE